VAGGQTDACLPPFFILDFGRMNNRYYKQSNPRTPLYLSNGQKISFPTADGSIGYMATTDEYLISELNTAINKHVGGISVSSQDEYKDYLKKKSSGLAPRRMWREEIKAGMSLDPGVSPHVVARPAEDQGDTNVESELPESVTQRTGKFKATG